MKFGLIGYPVSGSGSPALFERAYGGKWAYDLIEDPSFERAWARFIEGYDGVNVTAPFKEKAFLRADEASAACQRTGAANILVKGSDLRVKAYNSDYLGVRSIISGIVPTVTKVLVAGCGGAGKAAALAALDCGAEVVLANRTSGRAEVLSRRLGEWYPGKVRATPMDASGDDRYDLVVYTVPCPVEGFDFYAPMLLEANYRTPSFDEGTLAARSCRYIPGRLWLSEQARLGYELLTGEVPSM